MNVNTRSDSLSTCVADLLGYIGELLRRLDERAVPPPAAGAGGSGNGR